MFWESTPESRRKANGLFAFIGVSAAILIIALVLKREVFSKEDISSAEKVSARIEYASQVREKGARRRHPRLLFVFRLEGIPHSFIIHRSDEAYSIISRGIRRGDSVEVSFNATKDVEVEDVYEVKRGDEVVARYEDYKKDRDQSAGWILFIAVLLLFVCIAYLTKFSLLSFLRRLAEGPPNARDVR